MDWGLLRTTSSDKFLLRPKLLYSTFFYYYAALSNLIFRFFWTYTFFISEYPDLMLFLAEVIEGTRRF